jgi:competence protein ComEC
LIVYLAFGYWLFLWLSAEPNSQSVIKQSYPDPPFMQHLRQRFLDALAGVSEDARGLVAGLTIGERDMVSPSLAEQMRDLSLTHLVAVSGANLAIVMGAVYFLAAGFSLARNLRFVLALAVMLLYVLLVGPESSVIRAATMALFVMLGLWLGRGSSSIYALSCVVLLLLVIDPGLATDVGFALSAFATAGLVLIAPLLYKRFSARLGMVLSAGLAATIAAQVYTLPIILYLQPSLPIYSVVANLLVEWVVAPVTILGLIAVLLSLIFPPAAQLSSWLASLGTQWIVLVSQNLSDFPLVQSHFLPGVFGITAACLFAFLFTIWLNQKRFSRLSGLGAMAVVIVTAVWILTDVFRQQLFAGEWEIYACDVGQGDALLLKSGSSVMLIDVGPDSDRVRRCLAQAKVQAIQTLVLTHFDSDHVAGIDGLRGFRVGEVLISPFRDDRPVVEKVERALASIGTAQNPASMGQMGHLGSIRWQVLSPSAQAREAVDSNDASLTMVFDFGKFALLTLGDLGEEGQRRVLENHQRLLLQLRQKPLIVKVAHHGSADQLEELYEFVDPEFGLFLVGDNRYGHPTKKAIAMVLKTGGSVLRTDKQGPIAIAFEGELRYRAGGKLST